MGTFKHIAGWFSDGLPSWPAPIEPLTDTLVVDRGGDKAAVLLREVLLCVLLLRLVRHPSVLQTHVRTHPAVLDRFFVVVEDAAALVIGAEGDVGDRDLVLHQAALMHETLLLYHHRVLVIVHFKVLSGGGSVGTRRVVHH